MRRLMAEIATPVDRVVAVEQVATLAADRSVRLTPQELAALPEQLRRPVGSSRLRSRNSEVYASQEVLDTETRLLQAGRATDGPAVGATVAAQLGAPVAPGGRNVLSVEQATAVAAVITSGRRLDVLVGAAGTGKSTAMIVVRAAWEAEHQSPHPPDGWTSDTPCGRDLTFCDIIDDDVKCIELPAAACRVLAQIVLAARGAPGKGNTEAAQCDWRSMGGCQV